MNKELVNKIYIIYSLIVPVTYIMMPFFNYSFGTSMGDYTSRPLGSVSDIITFFISLIYILLSITQVILFFMNYKKIDIANTLILIFNSILAFLMELTAQTAWLMVGLIIAVFASFTMFLPITLLILGVYIFQIYKLVKIFKDKNQKTI